MSSSKVDQFLKTNPKAAAAVQNIQQKAATHSIQGQNVDTSRQVSPDPATGKAPANSGTGKLSEPVKEKIESISKNGSYTYDQKPLQSTGSPTVNKFQNGQGRPQPAQQQDKQKPGIEQEK